MENKQDCTKVYSIKGYAVQDNGIVRNSYGEYIGQLSDLEECEAKDAEIAMLKKQLEEKEAELLKWTSKYTCCNGSPDCSNNKTAKFCDYFIGGKWSDKHDELYGFLVENSMKQEFIESDLQAKDEILEKMREIFNKGENCPYCNNEGWFSNGVEQQQCEWCYTTENSKFNFKNEFEVLLNKEVKEKGSEE